RGRGRAARAAPAAPPVAADALLRVLPADHVIADVGAFRRAVEAALPAAREGRFVTFGVVPTQPETGYGYIRKGAATGAVAEVLAFVEKPDTAKAAHFVARGA